MENSQSQGKTRKFWSQRTEGFVFWLKTRRSCFKSSVCTGSVGREPFAERENLPRHRNVENRHRSKCTRGWKDAVCIFKHSRNLGSKPIFRISEETIAMKFDQIRSNFAIALKTWGFRSSRKKVSVFSSGWSEIVTAYRKRGDSDVGKRSLVFNLKSRLDLPPVLQMKS